MNKSTFLSLIAALALGFLFAQTFAVKAETKSFAGVVPFATPSGMVGFFNQNNGKIYIYDNNVSVCMFEGKIDELGKKAITIRADQPKDQYLYNQKPLK